jgi:hypothetical protein
MNLKHLIDAIQQRAYFDKKKEQEDDPNLDEADYEDPWLFVPPSDECAAAARKHAQAAKAANQGVGKRNDFRRDLLARVKDDPQLKNKRWPNHEGGTIKRRMRGNDE